MSALEEFASAIERGDSIKVDSLLTSGSVDVNARLPRQSGPPALVRAADLGRNHVVEMLLKNGARIDDTDDAGNTACHAAACRHHVDVLALLLAHSPDLGHTNANRTTPLQAVMSGLIPDFRVALMLIEAGAPLDGVPDDELCRFAAVSSSTVHVLLNRGIAVHELRDDNAATPLHIAVDSPRRVGVDGALLKTLVNLCGIDLEARDAQNFTCTCIAAARGNSIALQVFLQLGADVNCIGGGNDATPLMYVRDYDCAILLLAAGANVNTCDRDGRTALCWALLSNHVNIHYDKSISVVYVLLAAGAVVSSAIDHADLLPLAEHHLAVGGDDIDTARRDIAKARLDFVRYRALMVCIGLQSRGLDALQTCEILLHSCGPLASLISFHQWWKIATTVKHFKSQP
jgi:ankyrin repeat protein